MPAINSSRVLQTHPSSLYDLMDATMKGQDWYAWEPETMLREFPLVESDLAMDKLCAVQAVCANSDDACTVAKAFEKIGVVFNNIRCLPDTVQPMAIEEVYYTIKQMADIIKKVHGTDTKAYFTGEVPGYIATCAKYYDWPVLPKPLHFANDILNTMWASTRYEHHDSFDLYTRVATEIARMQLKSIADVSVKDIDKIDTSTPVGTTILRFIGVYLYDPTILVPDND